jgi:hypothetical protein
MGRNPRLDRSPEEKWQICAGAGRGTSLTGKRPQVPHPSGFGLSNVAAFDFRSCSFVNIGDGFASSGAP